MRLGTRRAAVADQRFESVPRASPAIQYCRRRSSAPAGISGGTWLGGATSCQNAFSFDILAAGTITGGSHGQDGPATRSKRATSRVPSSFPDGTVSSRARSCQKRLAASAGWKVHTRFPLSAADSGTLYTTASATRPWMEADSMQARIHWKTKEEGGRIRPPTGVGVPPYSTVVRFSDSGEPWPPQNAWSLIVEKIESRSGEYDWVANVRYLVGDAPHDDLRANREFELYEGGKCVATGIVLG